MAGINIINVIYDILQRLRTFDAFIIANAYAEAYAPPAKQQIVYAGTAKNPKQRIYKIY